MIPEHDLGEVTPLADSSDVLVPFTEDQVRSLNAFQQDGVMFHPFTCVYDGDDTHDGKGTETKLVATAVGLVCPRCGHLQNWAFRMMADWTWKAMQDASPFHNGEFLAAAQAREAAEASG